MKTFFTALLTVGSIYIYGQDYQIRIGGESGTTVDISKIPNSLVFDKEIKSLEIKKTKADSNPKVFKITDDTNSYTFLTDGQFHTVSFPKDIREIGLLIKSENEEAQGTPFILHKSKTGFSSIAADNSTVTSTMILMPKEKDATEFITQTLFKEQIFDLEGVGLIIKKGSKSKVNTEYIGQNYIHLFFDQNGNSLIRSIPLGISGASYVVHVIYLSPKDENNQSAINYSINQSTPDMDEGVMIRGSGDLQNNQIHLEGKESNNKTIQYIWRDSETLLSPSSFDIKFDIVRTSYNINQDGIQYNDPIAVASKIIKVKKVYHGSIDVGILKSNLENPTFVLTQSDADPNQMVVKKTNTGSRILASAMYTFYLSPIILLEKLFNPSKVRNYRIEGRSFVDDHKIYERIYPTVGVSLSEKVLENVFVGGKWEFIRGGSLFVGYHWGKVNILEVERDFEFEKTFLTQSSFDLKNKTKFKGGFAIGLNLDIRIITNLFQGSTQ